MRRQPFGEEGIADHFSLFFALSESASKIFLKKEVTEGINERERKDENSSSNFNGYSINSIFTNSIICRGEDDGIRPDASPGENGGN